LRVPCLRAPAVSRACEPGATATHPVVSWAQPATSCASLHAAPP